MTTPDTLASTLLTRTRRYTGLKPTGHPQLGNLLGAIRPVVDDDPGHDTIVSIVDLHALSVDQDPRLLADLTLEFATVLLAAGLDTTRTPLYVQSHVGAHTGLHYLLEAATNFGEARRMVQFKEKSAQQKQVRLALLTYPVLMASDILLFDTDEVPVGDDQVQHVELARDIAVRFNQVYGPVFTVPKAVRPQVAARIMDLADPSTKMGKTNAAAAGVVFLLDRPDVIRRKISRAVTDSLNSVAYDPAAQPGVSNLLAIAGALTGVSPESLASGFAGYGALKAGVTDIVVEALRPLQIRYAELAADPTTVRAVLADGARRVAERADRTLSRARAALGLLAP
jgi:tryptophanyl-tRNA synthetase